MGRMGGIGGMKASENVFSSKNHTSHSSHRSCGPAAVKKKQVIPAIAFLAAVATAYLLVSHFVFGTAIVQGDSMVPTLQEGDRCLINKLVYSLRVPRRGEIVCLRLPHTRGVSVKRVIALPGEHIQFMGGRILVNGRPLQETYLPGNADTDPVYLGAAHYEIATNSYFVLGDNRSASVDSRNFG